MTPGQLLERLEAVGIRLRMVDGFLKCRGPKAAYTSELKWWLDTHRQVLLEGWRCLRCGLITNPLFSLDGIQVCRACCSTSQALEGSSA